MYAYANGQIPAAALTPIPGGRLRKDAAQAWNAMDALAVRLYGRHLGVVDSYRPLGHPGDFNRGVWSQYAADEKYRFHGGNLAAKPGTSNHGLGLAVDVDRWTRWFIDHHGRAFGWAKAWSDAQSEWWHIKWRAGAYPAVRAHATFTPLRHGATGDRVKWVQRSLRRHGFKSVAGPGQKGYGFFGDATTSAVKRYQKAHNLKADGIVGKSTWAKLAL